MVTSSWFFTLMVKKMLFKKKLDKSRYSKLDMIFTLSQSKYYLKNDLAEILFCLHDVSTRG